MSPLVLAAAVWVSAAAAGILLRLRGTMAKPLPPAPLRDVVIVLDSVWESVAALLRPVVTVIADFARENHRELRKGLP